MNLFDAISRNNENDVRRFILEEGANIESRNIDGFSPLDWAAAKSNENIVRALVELGADLRSRNGGGTPLHWAAIEGKEDNVRALVNLGADIESRDGLSRTPLISAALTEHDNVVRALVQLDADTESTDSLGRTPLTLAVIAGKERNVRALIQLGRANIESRDSIGRTPLAWAASGQETMLLTLIELGAEIDSKDQSGRTPLSWAASLGKDLNVRTLFHRGADIESRDNSGRTPLSWAANGQEMIVRTLIHLGADIQSRDNFGRTPLTWANRDTVHLLESNPANLGARDVNPGDLNPGARDFPTLGNQNLRGSFFSMKNSIINIIRTKSNLYDESLSPFNISLDSDFSLDDNFGLLFRYGPRTIVSISNNGVAGMRATAPICIGRGKVIYTKEVSGRHNVYLNTIDLRGPEVQLCHNLSSVYEKNWGVFALHRQSGFIVYSVIPLRIFKFSRDECVEVNNVIRNYENFDNIEKMWNPTRDSRGTSIFRGGSRGILWGREYLFIGHITLHRGYPTHCFPEFVTQINENTTYPRMYYMYFYTIKIENGEFSLSRMSSCFQPPTPNIYTKIIFPVGISEKDGTIYVSYGLEDKDCLITSYLSEEVDVLLAPVSDWNEKNYVFYSKYALSVLSGFDNWKKSTESTWPVWDRIKGSIGLSEPHSKMHLLGTVMATDGRFNPSISRMDSNNYITAWRKFNGDVRRWSGTNSVSIETATVKIVESRLVYSTKMNPITIDPGPSSTKGEDPRIISANGCPVIIVNDTDANNRRRFYVQNLKNDRYYSFCHNISNNFEKNWGLFFDNDHLHFVYTVDPLVVGRVRETSCPSERHVEGCQKLEYRNTPYNLRYILEANALHIRGGTAGLRVSDSEFLFVGHAVQDKRDRCFPSETVQRYVMGTRDPWHVAYPKLYTIFFYTIGKDEDGIWVMKRLSCCSQLPGKVENQTKIVFPCGLDTADLDWENNGETQKSFIVSFGEKDDKGSLCAMTSNFLQFILRPVNEWNSRNYVVDVNYFANIATLSPQFNLHNFV